MNQIYAAKTNHITNPVGFLLNPVVFSWKVRDCRGKNQRCARILVAKDETFADVLWDTGEAKLDSLAVKAEMNLEPCTRYYWKVIVTTDADEVLESEVQFFETAKRDEPWAGKWITCDSREARHPIFSKQITLRKKVKKARLYICGLGLYEAYFTDGDKDQTDIPQSAKIGEEYLTPYCNNYNQWLQYQTCAGWRFFCGSGCRCSASCGRRCGEDGCGSHFPTSEGTERNGVDTAGSCL